MTHDPNHFRALMDGLDAPVLLLSETGRVLAANRASRRALDEAATEGGDLHERVAAPEVLRRVLRRALDEATPVTETIGLSGHATPWRCRAWAAGVGGEASVVVQLEREPAQREQAQRERVWAALRRYLRVVSHDLRNPINVLVFGIGVIELSAGEDAPPALGSTLTRMRTNIDVLQRMINQLRDFEGLHDGSLPVSRTRVDVDAVVATMVERFGAAHEAKITLRRHEGLTADTDPKLLHQLLWNLLRNATTHGEGDVRVALGVAGERAELIISNAGDVPPEAREGLLHAPEERGDDGGAQVGIGLFVAARIAASLGGSLELDTGSGRTIITVRLPRPAAAR